MSKKRSKKTSKKAGKKTRRSSRRQYGPRRPTAAQAAASAIKTAYTSNLRGGDYSAAIARRATSSQNDAIARQLAAMTKGMYGSKAKKAAKEVVLAASGGAANISLAPKKKRSSSKKRTSAGRGAGAFEIYSSRFGGKKPKSKSKSKVKTASYASVLKNAQTTALKQWVCEGKRRSGCGAGGTRVVPFKGQANFVRLRAPRFMGGK